MDVNVNVFYINVQNSDKKKKKIVWFDWYLILLLFISIHELVKILIFKNIDFSTVRSLLLNYLIFLN